MKRFITIATTAVLLLTPASASAQSILTPANPNSLFPLKVTNTLTPDIIVPKKESAKPKPAEPVKPEPIVYTVVDGDNLSKIGTAQNVEWQRLWAKNTQLSDPDVIHVGDKITVPLADEQLSREIPANVSLPAVTPGVVAPAAPRGQSIYDPGNTYDYGYCTWYVKNRRGASIPNSLGNANTWYYRAAALGMAVGSAPRAGAVGVTERGGLGHVVYVESVNGDGSINISEMNAPVFGGVTYRTASADEFHYIY